MSTAPILCDNCNAAGLPILPVRYVPVPSSVKQTLPGWASGERIKDVPLGSDFHYALRTLRAGYVYLFYSKNIRGANLWECYSVTEDGCLIKAPDPLMAPVQPAATVQCTRTAHSNLRLRHLVIERPDKCGTTWIGFSEHKWSEETLKAYTASAALRNERMQSLHPAAMATGSKNPHGAPASVAALEEIIEYSPNFSTGWLPHNSVIREAFSKEDGSFDPSMLTKVGTRYPWHQRQGGASDDLKFMQLRAEKRDGTHNVPHVLALWDTIGMAHELNGFRNDAAGWIALYSQERELQIHAGNLIDGLHQALVDRAGASQQHMQDEMLHHAASWYSPQVAAQQRQNAQRMPQPQRSHALEVCDILEDWARRQLPQLGYQGRLRAANELPEPSRSQQIAALKTEVDQFTQRRAKNYSANINRARAEAWPKYEDCIDQQAYADFKANRDKLVAAVSPIVERRTAAVLNWLEAPLFIATLEDFSTHNIADGLLFEDKVGQAMYGLGSSVSGARKLDEWVREANAGSKKNLVWRTVALNQQEGIAALDAALQEVKRHFAAQTLASAVTWTGYTSKVLKGLADTYKKAQSVLDANAKASSSAGSFVFGAQLSAVKTRGIDLAVVNFGDRVFKLFGIDKLGDYASEKIVQHIFTIRAFVDPLDSERLIAEQAKVEQIAREQVVRRLHATQAFMKLDTRELRTAQTEALAKAWDDFKAGADKVKAAQAIKDTRLALVVALIEGLNFTKLMADCKMKGDTKSYMSLLASGMSITSALFDTAATIAKNLPSKASDALPGLGSESWTYQALKGWGGLLSASATFIGAFFDLADAKKSNDKGYWVWALYMGKSTAGVVNGCLTLAVTFTYAAPLVSRLTGRSVAGAAIEAVGERAAAVIGLRIFGMALGGWITFGTLVLQVIIWQVTPDALQDWVYHSAFGKKRTSDGYKTVKIQELELSEALVSMGVK